MSNPLSAEQISYLKNVLGIEGFLVGDGSGADMGAGSAGPDVSGIDSAVAGVAASPANANVRADIRVQGDLHNSRLIVLASSESPAHALDGEPGDLARKMIQAMKLNEADVCFIEWKPTSPAPFEVTEWLDSAECDLVLVFGAATFTSLVGHEPTLGLIETWRKRSLLATFAPDELLVSPGRKRDAWSHLQLLMARL